MPFLLFLRNSEQFQGLACRRCFWHWEPNRVQYLTTLTCPEQMFLGCKRVTLSHLASWMWLQAKQARRGSGESTRAPFHLRSVPRSTRSVPPEHYYGAATGEPWTLGAQTSVNSSILLSQKIDEMGRGNASLFVYSTHFFCPINFFLSYI